MVQIVEICPNVLLIIFKTPFNPKYRVDLVKIVGINSLVASLTLTRIQILFILNKIDSKNPFMLLKFIRLIKPTLSRRYFLKNEKIALNISQIKGITPSNKLTKKPDKICIMKTRKKFYSRIL